ncbi:MAG: hypothetical protein AAGH89_04690 [Verrucomicrobiota bacterium]
MNPLHHDKRSLYLRHSMKAIYWMIFAGSLITLLAALNYSWNNKSGHTGFSPMAFSMLYWPVLVIGLLGVVLTKGFWLSPRMVVSIGLAGLAYGLFVTRLGILNEYGDWINARMPARNPNTSLFLIVFTLLGIGGSLLAAYLLGPKIESSVANPPSASTELS